MPPRESEQFALFETGLFLVGGCTVYLRNIRELVRLLPRGEGDIASAIDRNAIEALKRTTRAQKAVSELADVVGYKYLRRKERK